MKHSVFFGLLFLAALPLSAQARFGDVKVYLHPAVGGTATDREYFDFNLKVEIDNLGCVLTNSMYPNNRDALINSDFNITVAISYDTGYRKNLVTLKIYDSRQLPLDTSRPIDSCSLHYEKLTDMQTWNSQMIYVMVASAMVASGILERTSSPPVAATPPNPPAAVSAPAAPNPPNPNTINITILEQKPDAADAAARRNELAAQNAAAAAAAKQAQPVKPEYSRYWFYMGLRGGETTGIYDVTLPPAAPYDTNNKRYIGITFTAGLQARLDFFSWLGLQVEAIVTMDRLSAIGHTTGGDTVDDSIDILSMMLPAVLKINFHPGRFVIAPYGGVYANIGLPFSFSGLSANYQFESMPMGIVGGLTLGAVAGPGNFFIDARYAMDLGDISVTEANRPTYRRSSVSVSLGYEFGAGKKKSKAK